MHWLGALIFSHVAARPTVVVVAGVVGGEVVEEVVVGASVVGTSVVVSAVDVMSGGLALDGGAVDEVDVSEQATITPSSTTAIAAARLTLRSRRRSRVEGW
jgi:hypothetical protein